MLNRRHFLATLAATAACTGCASLMSNTKRPNIVLFLVDDMGWQDTSHPFWTEKTFLNRRYRTPNMERLAARGMTFTRAYAQCVCTPTRVSLMSGMNAARHRVTTWTLNCDRGTDPKHATLLAPDWNVNGLQPAGTPPTGTATRPLTEKPFDYKMTRGYAQADTIPALLKQCGYTTIHCGKAHFGAMNTPGANPKAFGFDYNIAGSAIGSPANYRGKNHYGQGSHHVQGLDENNYYEEDVFLTEALTREAIKRLDSVTSPFYLYMSHYAIHSPFGGDNGDPRFLPQTKDPKDGKPFNGNERNYATLIEGMDKSLGDLMDYLEKTKQIDNTVIIFMSDNGGLALSSSGRLGNQLSNYPLRSGKGSLYEGGIREPMIVSWPGTTHPGSTCNTPVIVDDFLPTILDIAGNPNPKTVQKLDGVSIVPLLRGKTLPERPLVFHFPNFWLEGSRGGPDYGPASAIILGDWKLIVHHGGKRELYNLANDISEANDLAEKQPSKLAELSKLLAARLTSCDAQMPLDATTKQPLAY